MVIFLQGANFTPQRGLKLEKFQPLFAIVFLKVCHLMAMFLISFLSSPRSQDECLARLWQRCDFHTLYSATGFESKMPCFLCVLACIL